MEFAKYSIRAVLEYYGFEGIEEDRGWRSVKCVFHDDKDASGSVNTTEQVYNCWSGDCPKGSAVQVVMKKEGLEYGDALRRTEDIVGDSHDEVRGGYRGRPSVPGKSRHYRSYREIKSSWVGEESDPGA